MSASFTERVRQELSRLALGSPATQRSELSALLRLGGGLHLHGPSRGDGELHGSRSAELSIELASPSGAVVRRAYALVVGRYGVRPELRVRAPGGMRDGRTYGLRLETGAAGIAADLGLLAEGRPMADLPGFVDDQRLPAYLRGALLGAGSVSGPDSPPHLEVRVGSRDLAAGLAAMAARWLDATVTATDEEHSRVVVKSGATIGDLLRAVGATGAYLAWEERRLRRRVRGEATRLANADAANVRRSIEAARDQLDDVEAAVARVGWDGLAQDLQQVALARLANPSASLAELGELCDPPVGKSAVHRRLRRLGEIARSDDDAVTGGDPVD